ncbi:MAG: DNA gyrase inhibitor YacG, partial [bacterium]|nr:DNA gyrase inhibitor YacG [bacterium]
KFLPFCSDRCRLIDLGRWLKEEHTLPCEPQDEEEQEETSDRKTIRLPPGWHDA